MATLLDGPSMASRCFSSRLQDLQRTTDRLINELRSPGIRAASRVEQLARIGAEALTDSE
jgi:hypothetical protein